MVDSHNPYEAPAADLSGGPGSSTDQFTAAMITALRTWGQRGAPANPAGWIHRVARNRALDALRRQKVHRRALSLSHQSEEATESLIDDWLLEERLPDSLLRMIFVCCHPALDRPSLRWIPVVLNLAGAALMAVMAWQSALYAIGSAERGEATNMLGIQIYPFQLVIAVSTAVFSAVLLVLAWRALRPASATAGSR